MIVTFLPEFWLVQAGVVQAGQSMRIVKGPDAYGFYWTDPIGPMGLGVAVFPEMHGISLKEEA